MLPVDEARRLIMAHFAPLGAQRVPLAEAAGRVLAVDVRSPENVPPFDNSSMDGYAVRCADTAGAREDAPIPLPVVATVAAGAVPPHPLAAGTAMRIMTGAPLPEGADAVVMREDTNEAPERVEIRVAPDLHEFIRRAGDDIRAGEVVFAAGTVLNAAALGVLGSIGLVEVEVVRAPRVALLATGDELVPLGAALGPGQIRNSSAIALGALLRALGCEVVDLGIARDEIAELEAKITEGARCDLLLTTGGVSVGDFDLVKQVLGARGRMNFWQVNMQPGKPLAFGHVDGTPVFGLPGNPVSSLVSFEVFVRPALRRLLGHAHAERPAVRAVLAAPLAKRNERRQYLRAVLRAVLRAGEAGFTAELTGPQGSHVLSSVARANALLVLPEGARAYAAGETVDALLLEEFEA